MKLFFAFGISMLIAAVGGFKISCDFSKNEGFSYAGNIYYCDVSADVKDVTYENRIITDIGGSHSSGKGNTDVKGFWNQYHKMQYIPSNLRSYYPNLIAVGFDSTEMKEVHKEDLRQFGVELIYFRLSRSDIEIIEEDLFIYNPNLKLVGLHNNKIKYISENVFDNLKSLGTIWLSKNGCIDQDSNDEKDVPNVIKSAKSNCGASYARLAAHFRLVTNDKGINTLLTKVDRLATQFDYLTSCTCPKKN